MSGLGAATAVDRLFVLRPECGCLPRSLLCCLRPAIVTTAALHHEPDEAGRRSAVGEAPGYGSVQAVDGADKESGSGGPTRPSRVLALLGLTILCVMSGVGNNVTFVLMADAVPSPSFLLYATTIVYTLMYGVWYGLQRWFGARKRIPVLPGAGDERHAGRMYSGPRRKMLLLYGASVALITVNGVFSQYSDSHVSGLLQSVANQLTLPLTAALAATILKSPLTKVEWIGAGIVLIGSLLPIVPSLISPSPTGSASNSPFWIAMFLVSDIPSAFVNIAEEAILDDEGMAADPIHYLFYTNLFTIPPYVACIFVDLIPGFGPGGSLTDVMHAQKEAWQCFFSSVDPLPPGCRPHAWIYVMAFCLAYIIYFFLLAVVTKHESASFQALVSACVVPASAIAFSFPWLVGASVATPLNDYVLIGIVIIPIGIAVYKLDDFVTDRVAPVPLIARH